MALLGFSAELSLSNSFSLLSVKEYSGILVFFYSPSLLEAGVLESLGFFSLSLLVSLLVAGSKTFLAYFIFSILSIYSWVCLIMWSLRVFWNPKILSTYFSLSSGPSSFSAFFSSFGISASAASLSALARAAGEAPDCLVTQFLTLIRPIS